MDSPDIINVLIKHVAEISAKDYNGWTPLMFAAKNGKLKIV